MSTVTSETTAPAIPEKPRRSFFARRDGHTANPAQQAVYTDGIQASGAPGHPGHAEGGYTSQPQPRRGFATGFSLVRWLRLHAVDLITMAAMGAVGLGVYEADPAPSRSFPVL